MLHQGPLERLPGASRHEYVGPSAALLVSSAWWDYDPQDPAEQQFSTAIEETCRLSLLCRPTRHAEERILDCDAGLAAFLI